MNKNFRLQHFLAFAVVLLSCRFSVAGDKPIDYCSRIATFVLQGQASLDTNVIDIINNPSCFFQASLSNSYANAAIAPARTSLWNAFQSLSGGFWSLQVTGKTDCLMVSPDVNLHAAM